MNTCLFTGETLTDATKDEHTILHSLGGRIISKVVSSSEFNQKSSEKVDVSAKPIYWAILSELSPALPSGMRTMGPPLDTPHHSFGNYRINKMGQMEMAGPYVDYHDSGEVKSVYGPDSNPEEILRISRERGLPQANLQNVEIEKHDVFYREVSSLNPFIEVCMLKCLLLTFDHLLNEDSSRFTRRSELEKCREVVRDFVLGGEGHDLLRHLNGISLGLQYESDMRGRYEAIAQEAGISWRPFAHQLIVSGSRETGTLDGVFNAFGEDPHAFRLSDKWSEPSFTHVLTNGIFSNQTASDLVTLSSGWTLGQENFRKSYVEFSQSERVEEVQEHAMQAAREVGEHRIGIYHQAVEYRQMKCDESVIDQITRATKLNSNRSKRLDTAIYDRLVSIFDGANLTAKKADTFILAIAPILDAAGDDALEGGSAVPRQGWDYWLTIHRKCFSALKQQLGWAGKMYIDETRFDFSDPVRLD